MSVWITRSAPDNLRTARNLRALGQKALMVPVVTMVARYQPSITSLPDAIVFTSAHAVRHFARHRQLASVPVFTASSPVADAASAAGYMTVTSTGDDKMLSDLIGHVLPPAARILLLCGDSTSPLVADRLLAQGCRVMRQAVYKSVPIHHHALAHVTGALDQITAIVVHSRSNAERIIPMLRDARRRGSLWCISEQATRACSDLHHVSIHIAPHPSEGSLLNMIARISPTVQKRPSRKRKFNAATLMSALRLRRSHRRTALNDNAPDAWRPDDDPDPNAA